MRQVKVVSVNVPSKMVNKTQPKNRMPNEMWKRFTNSQKANKEKTLTETTQLNESEMSQGLLRKRFTDALMLEHSIRNCEHWTEYLVVCGIKTIQVWFQII